METTHISQGKYWSTRIAPTPSGYLHLGNIYSFSVTAAFAHVTGGSTLLRIDDLDAARTRQTYINDIFDTLTFLGIPWNRGPRDSREFEKEFSQVNRRHLYDKALDQLAASGMVYACTCSRAELARNKGKGYPGTCRQKSMPLQTADASWRLMTRHDEEIQIRTPGGTQRFLLPEEMRDFVVRKKDGTAAYQLSSVVDDGFFGINLIVRGQDLWSSTLAQIYLAAVLGDKQFPDTLFYHHRLLYSGSGDKLSKSAGATSVRFLRSQGASPRQVYEAAGQMAGIGQMSHWRDLCGSVSQLVTKSTDAGRQL